MCVFGDQVFDCGVLVECRWGYYRLQLFSRLTNQSACLLQTIRTFVLVSQTTMMMMNLSKRTAAFESFSVWREFILSWRCLFWTRLNADTGWPLTWKRGGRNWDRYGEGWYASHSSAEERAADVWGCFHRWKKTFLNHGITAARHFPFPHEENFPPHRDVGQLVLMGMGHQRYWDQHREKRCPRPHGWVSRV